MLLLLQNRLESAVVHFLRPHSNETCLATNQVVACCVNTDIRLDKISRESTNELRPCWKTSLLLAGKTRNVEWFCYEKSRTTHYFLQQLFATCNNLIIFAARQIWFRGGETRKVAIQLVLQQRFKNEMHVFVASRKDYKGKKLSCLRS